ncbi:MAG: PAS domain S-box protein [Desulfobacterales bacterium]|nr:PAS domain S-box protein [Desulfobacterales bacterium]
MSNNPTYEELEKNVKDSEKKFLQLQKKFNKNQQFSEIILNSSPDVIYVYDLIEKRNVYSNDGIMRVLGYSAEEMKEMGEFLVEKLMHQDDFQIYLKDTLPRYQSAQDGEFIEHEYRMKHRKGQWRWLLSKESIFLRQDDGKPHQIFGIISDITEKRLSEQKYQILFKEMLNGYALHEIICNTEGKPVNYKFLAVNPAFEDITGLMSQDIEGKTVLEILPETELYWIETYGHVALTGEPTYFENYSKELNKHFEITAFQPAPNQFACIFQDVTERKQIQKRFQQAQKIEAVGTLAGGIAHDFNNMLSVITGNISYALSILNTEDELFEVLSDVQQGAKQAQSLTNQLLTFSKGGEPIKKLANLNQVIEESAEFVISGTKSRCEFNLKEDLWTVEVDAGQLNQAISNLVINANQAMPDGGIIKIRTENTEIDFKSNLPVPNGKYIKIIIEDQGIGIPEKYHSKIFEPYFSTKQKGSGLGLATTYSIIKKHIGHIAVFSDTDESAVFHIYLPATFKDFEKIEDKKKGQHYGFGSILIMDDKESIFKMASRMLNRIGYDTFFASDGEQAIEMYKNAFESEKPFDMVILDLTVPGGMGGTNTIPKLLRIDPKVKAVVSSGYSNDPIMANYQDYGFCGVVPKPYTKDQLIELLNKVLNKGIKLELT